MNQTGIENPKQARRFKSLHDMSKKVSTKFKPVRLMRGEVEIFGAEDGNDEWNSDELGNAGSKTQGGPGSHKETDHHSASLHLDRFAETLSRLTDARWIRDAVETEVARVLTRLPGHRHHMKGPSFGSPPSRVFRPLFSDRDSNARYVEIPQPLRRYRPALTAPVRRLDAPVPSVSEPVVDGVPVSRIRELLGICAEDLPNDVRYVAVKHRVPSPCSAAPSPPPVNRAAGGSGHRLPVRPVSAPTHRRPLRQQLLRRLHNIEGHVVEEADGRMS